MWAKVDDHLHSHYKFASLPMSARGLWITCLSWCSDQLTDGEVPARMVTALGARKRDAEALVEAGLWERTETGFAFHDWAVYQPSEWDVRQRSSNARRQHRKSGAAGGRKTASNRAKSSSKTAPNTHQTLSKTAAPNPNHYSVGGKGAVQGPLVPPQEGVADATREQQKSTGRTPSQLLLGEWLDHCDVRPPKQVIARTGKELKALTDEGFTADQIRPGLQRWSAKGLSPAALAGVVNECLNSHPERVTNLKEVEYFT